MLYEVITDPDLFQRFHRQVVLIIQEKNKPGPPGSPHRITKCPGILRSDLLIGPWKVGPHRSQQAAVASEKEVQHFQSVVMGPDLSVS